MIGRFADASKETIDALFSIFRPEEISAALQTGIMRETLIVLQQTTQVQETLLTTISDLKISLDHLGHLLTPKQAERKIDPPNNPPKSDAPTKS